MLAGMEENNTAYWSLCLATMYNLCRENWNVLNLKFSNVYLSNSDLIQYKCTVCIQHNEANVLYFGTQTD